ncbi:MAG: hypothetical protein K0S08_891 [Gammaproteobacteria bacterium]|jgi:hypothetical protein|nr:hypothetical protein [Gammaproteobacteria bacterium]
MSITKEKLKLLEEIKQEKCLLDEQKQKLIQQLTSPLTLLIAFALGVGGPFLTKKRTQQLRKSSHNSQNFFLWEMLFTTAIFGFKKILQYPIFHSDNKGGRK